MAQATANGIQLEYDTFGDRSGRPLLLIMGFGGQMIHWSEEVCNQLAEGGHYAIRFDNRDSGFSRKCEDLGVPDQFEILKAIARGKESEIPPYTYYDMGDDAAGLLDVLGIEHAHLCGLSTGAAIAQTVAINHPLKVSSLISISGTTGNPGLPTMRSDLFTLTLNAPLSGRDDFIEYFINFYKTTRGSAFPFEEAWTRRAATEAYDRSFYPDGLMRHFVAGFHRGDRRNALATVTAPTLVIHGEEDPLFPVEGGRDTAEVIPGAELMIIKGMGHELPYRGAWPQIVEAITAHTRKFSV